MFQIAIIILILSSSSISSLKPIQKKQNSLILVNPKDLTVTVNSTVIFKCQVKPLPNIKVQWMINSFGFSANPEEFKIYSMAIGDENKYTLPNDASKGYYDMKISRVSLKDEGIYKCQASVNSQDSTSTNATLIVLMHSERPIIHQMISPSQSNVKPTALIRDSNSPITVENGAVMRLNCSAMGGRPSAQLYWKIAGEKVIPDSQMNFQGGMLTGTIKRTVVRNKRNRQLWDAYSTLTAKVNQIFNGKSIECYAVNRGYKKYKLPPVKSVVKILTPPLVSMYLIPKKLSNMYTENDIITASCEAEGNPNKFIWTWYLNNEKIDKETTNTYKFKVTREFHKANLKCVATNFKEGFSNKSILVKYSPQFQPSLPSVYASQVGGEVKLSCYVDSNPPANLLWQRESSNEILGYEPALYRKNIQESDFGMYTCTARIEGFTSISRKVYLAKKKRPEITLLQDRTASVGKSIQIKCTINSIPIPVQDQISWFFRGRKLFEGTKYAMYQENYFVGTNSILEIKNLEYGDFGRYNCSVTTALGAHWKTMELTQTDKLAYILIVSGTVSLVTVLLVIIIVVCLCRRGIWNRKYQKGSPMNKTNVLNHHNNSNLSYSEHSGPLPPHHQQQLIQNIHQLKSMLPPTSMGAPVFDEYQCQQLSSAPPPNQQGGLFQWFPLVNSGGSNRTSTTEPPGIGSGNAKSSFVRYGQDVDDRSSIRNGSIAQYRGIDMCSTYTSSIPGSNNGDGKGANMNQMRPGDGVNNILSDDGNLYNADTLPQNSVVPGMMYSMHASPSIPHHNTHIHHQQQALNNNGGSNISMVPPPPPFSLNTTQLLPPHHQNYSSTHANIAPYQPTLSISPNNTLYLDGPHNPGIHSPHLVLGSPLDNHPQQQQLDMHNNGQPESPHPNPLDCMTTSYSMKSNNSRHNIFNYPLAQSTICNNNTNNNTLTTNITSSIASSHNSSNNNMRCHTLERNNHNNTNMMNGVPTTPNRNDPVSSFTGTLSNADKTTNI